MTTTRVPVIPADVLALLVSDIVDIVGDHQAIQRRLRETYSLYDYFIQIRQDLRRQEMYNFQTTYCVDFSEIHAYIHPTSATRFAPSTSQSIEVEDSAMAEIVLEHSNQPMTLLVPTLYELLDH